VTETDRVELSRYFDGELTDAERERVELELGRNPAARSYVEHLRLLRALTRDHDPSCAVPPATLGDGMPWRVAPSRTFRPIRWAAGAAAAAAIIVGVWWTNRMWVFPDRDVAVTSPDQPRSQSTQPPGITETEVSIPQEPADVPAASDLDAQRLAWANGELSSPTAAARVVLDHRPRHGARPPHVEILAIELAHVRPESMQEVTRELVERSTSMRQTAPHARPATKPAPVDSPQGSLQNPRDGGTMIAGGPAAPGLIVATRAVPIDRSLQTRGEIL
jgi:hypothetical protein